MSMSKSPDTAQQIKYITSVFRALITSRKQPCTLREILREYPEVESKPINYTKLGFKSVEELLRESGDFVLTKLGGETCIAAKYSKNSSHIALMVRGQKSSSSKSNKTNKKAQVRQPQRPADQSWNKSSYSSNVYQKLPPSLNRFIVSQNSMNGDDNNNTNQINNRNPQQKQLNAGNRPQQAVSGGGQKDLRDKLNTKKDGKMMANGQQKQHQQQPQQQQSGMDLRDKINNTKQNSLSQQQHQYQQQQQQQQNKNKNGPRAILGQNNNANGVQQHNQHRQQSNPCEHLQNSNAISIASSLILAQRQQQAMHQQMQQSSRHNQSQQHNQRMQQQQLQHQQLQQQQQQQQQKRHQQQPQSQPQQLQQQQQKLHQQNSLANQNTAQANMKLNKQQQQQPQQQLQQLQPGVLGKNSVQDRLKIKLSNNNYNANNNFNVGGAGNGSTGTTPESSPVISSAGSDQNMPNPFGDRKHVIKNETQETQQIIPPKVFQFNPKLDPVTSLSQYCVVRRCLQPEYSFFRMKFTKLFQCRVLVNGSIYSTYPNEYPSEQTAKFSCAAMAIEEIKVQECRRHLPICPDNDYELTMKIYQELKSHPHGIFAKNLPEWFENTFEQLLPDHWWSLIEGSKQFVTETTASETLIIFANNDFENGDGLDMDSESFTMEAINLPWESKYWNLYVTHCVSTIEIWGRLFGKQYSDQFDDLMNDIDVYMVTEKVRPVSVACKQIYLVCISECWHRVRLDEVDKLNGVGLCFFIDFGDEDWVPVCQLYICDKRFLKLAPQAVSFSLFGLEDFAGNPNAKRHLDTMLASKSVVGEILSKEDVYQAGVTEGSVFRIQVVLYDTSSQEDVNLNPLILHQICDDTPPPEIKRSGLTNVLITHITDAGDVFLQVRNSELQYVQKLIQQLIESKFKEEQHKVTRGDIQRSNLFLICDKATNQWYRGALANTTNQLDGEEFDIFYIDHGMTKRTHISNMFQLESLSTALSKFPRQGIKAKLDNIPQITPGIVARMRGLLPADSRALVKIGTPSVVPLIVVYKRFEGSEALCNVNEVIRIEQELESSNSDLLDENASTSPNDCKSLGGGSSGGLPSTGTSSRNSSSADLNQTFRNLTIKTNSVPNSPQKSDYMLKLRNYDEVPSIGEFFDVRVTMSANPCNFMVQPYKNFPELRKLMMDLQDYCANNDEFIPVDMVEKGQAYAGKNKDGFYHRVVVVNIYHEMIHVSFCDFGDVDVLRSDQLKTLPAKFRQLPKQAIQAKLYGISACNIDWTMEDCLRFRELTVGQKFVSVIKKITDGDKISPQTRILELDLIDVQTDDDIYIREILLKEGRAVETTGGE